MDVTHVVLIARADGSLALACVPGVHSVTTGMVYVVTEGTYTMKAKERERRSDAAKKCMAAGKYNPAVALPDCVVRLVQDSAKEGEAEIMALLRDRSVKNLGAKPCPTFQKCHFDESHHSCSPRG
jgi:hypothetical protein